MSTASPPTPVLYRDALALARRLGNEELGAWRDALAYELADLDRLYGGAPTAALLVGEPLRAATDELDRRTRLRAAGATVPDPGARRYEAWRELARQVRERADVVAVFAEAGHHLERAGRAEWAGACLACAGRDRFRVFAGPPGRYWCRRCGLRGDAIAAARTLLGLGFFAAVRHLAARAGLPVPAASAVEDAPRHRPARRVIKLPPREARRAG